MLNERLKKIYLLRHILWDLTIKQLRTNYAGSRFGIWWAVFTPLILATSINFIFTQVFKINIPNYTLFALAGIIPWIFFVNALSEVTQSFIVSSPILRQGIFPREFIPLSYILAHFINFLIGFVFLLPLFIIANLKVVIYLPFLFAVILFHLVFLAGMGLFFSCINVFFRDISHFLSVLFMIWFWVTPVFYPLGMLAYPFRWVCLLNPMTYYIVSYQQILFEVKAPSLFNLSLSIFIALFFLILGYTFFLKEEAGLLKKI